MLGKLLKYNLKDSFKGLIVFYILAMFFSLLTRIFFGIENSFIMSIIASILSGVTISMIINILINNIIRVWVRFRQNLYGDESYLTHTLPIKKSVIYLSKFLNTVIILLISFLVIALTLFIAYYSKENIEMLKNILIPFEKAFDLKITGVLFAVLFILFLEILNMMQAGYTGIILGHRLDSGKIGFSVLIGFVSYMVTQVFVVAVVFIAALFNKDLMDLFFSNQITNFDSLKLILYIAMATYSAIVIILYFVNVKLFKKGVNVD